MAVANFHAERGHYPPAYIADDDGTPMHSWRVLILPYLGEEELFERYDFEQPWHSEANLQLAKEMPSIYVFHGDHEPGTYTTNYLAVVGESTMWPGSSARRSEQVTDESSSTILLVENTGENVHWMEPRDLHIDSMSRRFNDPKGVSSKYLAPAVVMLDGSLRRLDERLSEDVLGGLLTANGGEHLKPVGDTWQMLPDGRSRKESTDSLNAHH